MLKPRAKACCSLASRTAAAAGTPATAGAAGGAMSRQKWQATACPPSAASGGVSAAQRACAYGQRVRKRQPDGGSIGLGTSPCRIIRLRSRAGRRHRNRRQQRLRVRMARPREQLALSDAYSTMRPEVHDGDARGDVLDHREIVRDEHVGEAEALLQVHAAG